MKLNEKENNKKKLRGSKRERKRKEKIKKKIQKEENNFVLSEEFDSSLEILALHGRRRGRGVLRKAFRSLRVFALSNCTHDTQREKRKREREEKEKERHTVG